MHIKIKTLDPVMYSVDQQIKFHQERGSYYCRRFNSLPIFQVRCRELAQILCEMHMGRVLRLQAGEISFADQNADFVEGRQGRIKRIIQAPIK